MAVKLNYLGGTDWENGNVLDATDLIETIKESSLFSHPIGSVVGWDKSLTGVPALPGVWVECNGQTLSDAESPLNGQVIRDLNGENRFLRGNSESGGTGGVETHNHQWASQAGGNVGINASGGVGINVTRRSGDGTNFTIDTGLLNGNYNTDTKNNEPPYMDVVWIMRVK